MSAQSPSTPRQKPAASAKTAKTGGPAGISIAGFPQILYTRNGGDPDALFVPLLDAAREAFAMSERLAKKGEKRETALLLSAMQLASSFLRDSQFSLVAGGQSHENLYRVDLAAGTLHLHTRLYAVVSRRASLFRVDIAGKITGGPYFVRNPVQGTVITQIEESQLRQTNPFSSWIAQECLRAQLEQERVGRLEETLASNTVGEIRLIVPVAGETVPITLRQRAVGGAWDVIDARHGEYVSALPPEAEDLLKKVISKLQMLFLEK